MGVGTSQMMLCRRLISCLCNCLMPSAQDIGMWESKGSRYVQREILLYNSSTNSLSFRLNEDWVLSKLTSLTASFLVTQSCALKCIINLRVTSVIYQAWSKEV